MTYRKQPPPVQPAPVGSEVPESVHGNGLGGDQYGAGRGQNGSNRHSMYLKLQPSTSDTKHHYIRIINQQFRSLQLDPSLQTKSLFDLIDYCELLYEKSSVAITSSPDSIEAWSNGDSVVHYIKGYLIFNYFINSFIMLHFHGFDAFIEASEQDFIIYLNVFAFYNTDDYISSAYSIELKTLREYVLEYLVSKNLLSFNVEELYEWLHRYIEYLKDTLTNTDNNYQETNTYYDDQEKNTDKNDQDYTNYNQETNIYQETYTNNHKNTNLEDNHNSYNHNSYNLDLDEKFHTLDISVPKSKKNYNLSSIARDDDVASFKNRFPSVHLQKDLNENPKTPLDVQSISKTSTRQIESKLPGSQSISHSSSSLGHGLGLELFALVPPPPSQSPPKVPTPKPPAPYPVDANSVDIPDAPYPIDRNPDRLYFNSRSTSDLTITPKREANLNGNQNGERYGPPKSYQLYHPNTPSHYNYQYNQNNYNQNYYSNPPHINPPIPHNANVNYVNQHIHNSHIHNPHNPHYSAISHTNSATAPPMAAPLASLFIPPHVQIQQNTIKNQKLHYLKEYSVCGLKNFGSSCYINLTIQLLFGIYHFKALFSNLYYHRFIKEPRFVQMMKTQKENGTKNHESLLSESVSGLLRTFNQHGSSSISPTKFIRITSLLKPDFNIPYEQQDAQEFLLFILERLHQELANKKAVESQFSGPELDRYIRKWDITIGSNEKDAYIKWYQSLLQLEGISPINDMFQGHLQNKLLCNTCGFESVNYSSFTILSLPIPNYSGKNGNGVVDLSDCLRYYTQDEVLSGDNAWNCPKCHEGDGVGHALDNHPVFAPKRSGIFKLGRRSKSPVPPKKPSSGSVQSISTKKLNFVKLPRVLLIHLSRFSFNLTDKLNVVIQYPLILKFNDHHNHEIGYKLSGLINHYGTLKSGHYTALVNKSGVNEKNDFNYDNLKHPYWCLFDDDNIRPNLPHGNVNQPHLQELTSRDVYVLCYERI